MEAGDNRRRLGLRPGLRSRQLGLFWAAARPRNQLSDASSDSSLNDEPSEKVGCLDALSAATSLDIRLRASADSKAPPAAGVFLWFADFPPSTRCPYSWNVLWVSQKHSLGPEIA